MKNYICIECGENDVCDLEVGGDSYTPTQCPFDFIPNKTKWKRRNEL